MSMLDTNDVVLSEKEFCQISDLVYQHCGINLHKGKKELVQSRLIRRIRGGDFKTFENYIQHVLKDKTGKAFSTLIDSLSTNLTSFFREYQHFEFLSEKFLPSLMARKRKEQNLRLRGWSAGCSSGEEPYSIAITLLEAISGQGRWDMKLLATDISTKMLGIAQQGFYEKERVDAVAPMLKNKYLIPVSIDGQKVFQVADTVRNMVIFRHLNLMKDWPVRGPLDFIFCRNVMIYFDKPTQEKLVNRFWELLGSQGILFTGHSESLTGIRHKFDYVQPTIYRKP
jgi:chemotaxis protein methyltransferase CheR